MSLINGLGIDYGSCCYCGQSMINIKHTPNQFTIDHVYPQENGGTNCFVNRLPVCRSCNEWKANNSLEYFLSQASSILDSGAGDDELRIRWTHIKNAVPLIIEIISTFKEKIYKYGKLPSM